MSGEVFQCVRHTKTGRNGQRHTCQVRAVQRNRNVQVISVPLSLGWLARPQNGVRCRFSGTHRGDPRECPVEATVGMVESYFELEIGQRRGADRESQLQPATRRAQPAMPNVQRKYPVWHHHRGRVMRRQSGEPMAGKYPRRRPQARLRSAGMRATGRRWGVLVVAITKACVQQGVVARQAAERRPAVVVSAVVLYPFACPYRRNGSARLR